jgi:hypothetical protein
MRRRDFIVNSLIALCGTALLSGCGPKSANTVLATSQIARRKFANITTPLLGFGCMRLPRNVGGQVDMGEFEKMVDYAMDSGVNFFDTAWFYMDGKSESIMAEALKKYERESYYISTKSPLRSLKAREDVLKFFNEQLQRCRTSYFDFYMAHNINPDTIDAYRDFEVYEQLLPLKKEGKIKHLGFSFHGSVDMLRQLISEREWDFCMLQLNYYDWEILHGGEMYDIATKAGVPIIVMEPLRGGGLCELTPSAQNLLEEKMPGTTPTDYALRWLSGKENIFTILSGMSKFEHIKENVATLKEGFVPLTPEQMALSVELVRLIKAQGEINCTDCKYCVKSCPRGVNIPEIFVLYNTYKTFGNRHLFVRGYDALKNSEKISRCIECGSCRRDCPQGLDIPEVLKQIANELA